MSFIMLQYSSNLTVIEFTIFWNVQTCCTHALFSKVIFLVGYGHLISSFQSVPFFLIDFTVLHYTCFTSLRAKNYVLATFNWVFRLLMDLRSARKAYLGQKVVIKR